MEVSIHKKFFLMSTKIIYTLVSSEIDYYLEQALLSAYSAKLHNPSAVIELYVDEETYVILERKSIYIKNYFNKINKIETPTGFNNMQKSRYLKTNLRNLAQGDFLFIDCDTIICGNLEGIEQIDAEIAMVSDQNGPLPLQDQTIIKRCKTAGLGNQEEQPYFNSGVIYAKDTPRVHQFYETWYKNWLLSSQNGVNFDQPALCCTNKEYGYFIQELNGIWNCQFKMEGYPYLKEAKIMHYYANNGNKDKFYTYPMDFIYQELKDTGEIHPDIAKLVKNAKTDFYAVMTLNKKQAFSFYNSHMLFLYTNRPKLYRLVERIANCLEHILY